jgi:hypothetical protein
MAHVGEQAVHRRRDKPVSVLFRFLQDAMLEPLGARHQQMPQVVFSCIHIVNIIDEYPGRQSGTLRLELMVVPYTYSLGHTNKVWEPAG